MNAASFAAILVVLTTFPSAFFVYRTKPKSATKTSWCVYNVLVGIWALCFSTSMMGVDQSTSLVSARIANLSALFIPTSFYFFVAHFSKTFQHQKTYIYGTLLLNVIIFIPSLLFPSYFIPSVSEKLGIFYYANPAFLYYIYTVQFAITTIVCHILLYVYLKKSKIKKIDFNKINQIKFIFYGTLIAFLGGSSTFLLIYDIPIYPIGIYLVPIYVIASSYAIIKHNLWDITVVIKKGLIYSILITQISIFYLILIFCSEKYLQNVYGYQSFAISITIAIFLGFIFVPLRNRIQYFVEKRLYKSSAPEASEKIELLEREVADKEKFKAVATLASGMSHEIKNPLTAIKTFSEHLPHKTHDPEFLHKFSKIVGSEVDRIDQIVNQLLTFSKPSPLDKKDTNLHKLIDETLDFLNSQFIDKHITIKRYYDSSLETLYIDANRMRQALLNLCLNAVDAMPKGGTITISTQLNKQSAIITVEDTGIGIPKDKLKNIFDPFFTQKDHGTGLGLSITKTIIDDHQGKIGATSTPGQGTQFIIQINNKADD